MKNKAFTVYFLLFFCHFLSAQNLLTEFSFDGCIKCTQKSPNYQPQNGNITDIQQYNLTPNSNTGCFSAKNWSTNGIDLSKYYFFKIHPNNSYLLNLSKIELDEDRTSTGIRHWSIRSSVDNFTTDLLSISIPDNTSTRKNQILDLSNNLAFQNLNSEVEFRIYGYEAEKSTGRWYIDNLKIYGTIPDIVPPTFTTVTGAPPNRIKLAFSEKLEANSALNPQNYTLNSGSIRIHNISFQNPDNKVVIIEFSTNLKEGNNYQIITKNIQDLAGNVLISQTETFTFTDNSPPEIDKIEVPSEYALDIFFDEKIEKSSAEDLGNYTLKDKSNNSFPTPISAVLSSKNPQKISLFFNQNFTKNELYTLTVFNLSDLKNNQNSEIQKTFEFDTKKPKIQMIKAVSSNILELYFSENIDPITAKIFNNYSVDNQIGFPEKINIISDKKVQLIFKENFILNTAYKFKISNIRDLQGNQLSTTSKTFFYDTKAPQLLKIEVLSNSQIRLIFSENLDQTSAEAVTNFRITNTNQHPLSAKLDSFFPNILTLTFTGIANKENLNLNIQNLKDINLNTIQSTINQKFSTKKPFLYQIHPLSKTEISLHFSQPLEKSNTEKKSVYEISQNIGKPSKVHLHPTDFTTVFLTVQNSLELNEKYQLSISEIMDIQNDKSINLKKEFTFENYIQNITPVSENLLNILFEYSPQKSDAENARKYEIESFGQPIIALRDLENPNLVHLQFASAFESDRNYHLKINNIRLESRQITPFQNQAFQFDARSPSVQTVTVIGTNELLVKFSEAISDYSVEALNFFEVNQGIGFPIEIQKHKSNPNFVSLKFTNLFQLNKQYTLTIQYIEDLQGNRMLQPQTISFQRPVSPSFQAIIFNEIFPDPEPSQSLPKFEFLELYNNGNQDYDLGGLQLSDGKSNKILESFRLNAGDFVVLCPKEAESQYKKYGHVLALESWLSLTNSGKNLYLKDWDGNIIDSVAYSDYWYQDTKKKTGGWSLEKIDYQTNCSESESWSASLDTLGGTPAKTNSIYQKHPDKVASQITGLTILNTDSIQISFTEIIEESALSNTENYQFTPFIPIERIKIIDNKNIIISFQQKIDSSYIYTIFVNNLKDCAGNTKPDTTQFAIGQRATKNDIIISEIMPKESDFDSLQTAEYLEIYNRTDKLISLKSIILKDGIDSINLPNYFLQKDEYLVLTSSKNIGLFENAIGVLGFPSLNNSGEKLVLQDTSEYEIFSVIYSDSLLKKIGQYEGGYSLEIIDLTNSNTLENWSISGAKLGGTPSKPNQPILNFPNSTEEILEDKVVGAKRLEVYSVKLLHNSKIEVIFNQKIKNSSMNTNQVYLNNNIFIKTLEIKQDSILQISMQKPLDFKTVYQLSFKNIESHTGDELEWYNFKLAITKRSLKNWLWITEIMADETPVIGLPETEYIEIYNRSDSIISLEDIQFEDEKSGITLPNFYLLPQEFVLICPSSKADRFQSKNVLGVSNFPSLNNSSENLILRNIQNNQIIYSIKYSNQWYQNEDKASGGWSLEMIDLNASCQGATNWRSSENSKGGTPAEMNSINGKYNYIVQPKLQDLIVESDSSLILFFNVDLNTLGIDKSNFTISPNVTIQDIYWITKSQVKIKTNSFTENKFYKISIKDISDCFENHIEIQNLEFEIGASPHFGELKITELMLDPNPSINLPNAEYIEIFNASEKLLSLKDLKLVNENDTLYLPTQNLDKNDYILICDEDDISEFRTQFSDIFIIGLENLFSLNNTKSSLKLLSPINELIFSVNYTSDFYKHPEKNTGGWSIEMRDINYSCASSRNWEASNNPNGGTPAQPNSVQFDINDSGIPYLLKVKVIAKDSIQLVFDKELNFSKIENFEIQFDFSNPVKIQDIIPSQNDAIILVLKDTLKSQITYEVQAKNIVSCNGKVQLATQQLSFRIPEKAQIGDMILNEILFNPPVGGVDFVELHNTSNKFINLQNWFVATIKEDSLNNLQKIITKTLIIAPYSYVILTENIQKLKGFYPNLSDSLLIETNLPTLSDSEGTIIILNPEKILFDRLDYSDNWHSDLLRNTEGVSLERISSSSETNNSENWQSSASPVYATPTKINSQNISKKSNFSDECISFNSEIITPDNDGINDFIQIQFHCLKSGTMGNIDIYDATGQKVKQLIQNQLLSNYNFVRWDGVNEEGQKVRTGYFILYFELFDETGNMQRIRKTVVVGTSLR